MKRLFRRCLRNWLTLYLSIQKFLITKKNYIVSNRLNITINDSREEIMNLIAKNQEKSETALLALYVYRQMDEIDWRPFIKAAIERNPVSFTDPEWEK